MGSSLLLFLSPHQGPKGKNARNKSENVTRQVAPLGTDSSRKLPVRRGEKGRYPNAKDKCNDQPHEREHDSADDLAKGFHGPPEAVRSGCF